MSNKGWARLFNILTFKNEETYDHVPVFYGVNAVVCSGE
jgi:hypothetical protein